MHVDILDATIELDESLVDDATPAEIRRQVVAYGRGERTAFDLELSLPDGFLGDVMGAMMQIPYGETRTYGELATALDTAPVAVGQACGRNPIPLLVPCHRVVATDGGLGGYSATGGVATKRRLLALEEK
ncbi:O-6-methylguanine DNA methyltransferase [Halovivax ruber XH-70]|uniref:methylated-DNA--[protein]-cysteine S-methyltransferase n=1 Tax=Halovivax ruber (strain DSM 18193 / JCM 13892 / XH-70) TaxID=797302 RepID=L0ICG1_HALRX|nr:methylated-DNA--[protein]-cysteine S-methyltransferase [Halovivax ruber]AGB15652.1 O-6-methylguanine DNA methyltransferase [Halovivax ruber XH-70]